MWRALFLAIGMVLVLIGLECTVVGRFTISKEARLPRFVQELWGENSTASRQDEPALIAGDIAPPQSINGYGGIPNSVSRFGQSRYGANQDGNDRFFSNSNSATRNSQFSLTGYGANANAPAPPPKSKKPSKVLKTQDWMPWSLIAAGTIIVLYTNSLTRRQAGG